MKGNVNNILIPNVSKLPQQKKVDAGKGLNDAQKAEFSNLLQEQLAAKKPDGGINLSVHAARRLQERNLEMDADEYMKVKGAMDKLRMKGGQDSLIITGKAAYIVDVDKNTIVTAMDKASMAENVFTKIDSTVIVN